MIINKGDIKKQSKNNWEEWVYMNKRINKLNSIKFLVLLIYVLFVITWYIQDSRISGFQLAILQQDMDSCPSQCDIQVQSQEDLLDKCLQRHEPPILWGVGNG